MDADERRERVESGWEFLRARTSGRLREVVERAYQEPELRRLYPYKSVASLAFSYRVEWPYDLLPSIEAEGSPGGPFTAWDEHSQELAKGDLETVIAAVARDVARRQADRRTETG